ncbi:MAG TPA: enoyl-CoA hydratase [Kineosporiaceae bacterium]
MTAPASTEIGVHRDGAVLRITLNRPERLNALTAPVLADLADLLAEAAEDPGVRAVVLSGAGRAFSSGADLAAGPESGEPPDASSVLAANRVIRSLASMPQPVVAAVDGPAAGLGCSIALGCDLVVAADTAYFLLAFVNIGLMPDGGATALVPAAIGRARAMEMALVPERIPAAQAREWGLIYRVVPAADLAGTVEALLARLVAGPPLALAATKRAVNATALEGLEPALQRELDGQGALLRSADFAEGVAAFGAKRTPLFGGA